MLILAGQKDESIVICDEQYNIIAEITIVDVRGDKVRLGTSADKKYLVHRKEVYEAIQKKKEENKHLKFL